MEKVNFREIAKELNVSHMTLYRVINKAPNVRAVTRNRGGYSKNCEFSPSLETFADIAEWFLIAI